MQSDEYWGFYQRHRDGLYRYALHLLRDPQVAEEVLQEAFVRALERGDRFLAMPEEERLPWCVVVLKHLAVDRLRRDAHSVLPLEIREESGTNHVQESSDYHELIACIRRMPDTYRRVLELKLVLEWSEKEIARSEHLSLAAVSARISRGRKLLQKRLREEGYHYG